MKKWVHPYGAAFSLVELLVVIAILIAMLALAVPAFNSLGRASHLTTGANLVIDELNLARQTALTKNRVTEVRFYLLRHAVDPAEAYRAFRVYASDESGQIMTPLGPIKFLPPSVVALGDDQFSTLLSEASRPRKTEEEEDLPGAPGTRYKPIRFRSTGAAELAAYTGTNDMWFLTLKNETDPSTAEQPAPNFATIQLDPATGRCRQFRP